mmetsp:Transcript_18261/g.42651  ORF Transcript_18261/g.42651 Transcript_18261/m.42651 type:complete len:230 (-) Transcript_18261:551-1240(-)
MSSLSLIGPSPTVETLLVLLLLVLLPDAAFSVDVPFQPLLLPAPLKSLLRSLFVWRIDLVNRTAPFTLFRAVRAACWFVAAAAAACSPPCCSSESMEEFSYVSTVSTLASTFMLMCVSPPQLGSSASATEAGCSSSSSSSSAESVACCVRPIPKKSDGERRFAPSPPPLSLAASKPLILTLRGVRPLSLSYTTPPCAATRSGLLTWGGSTRGCTKIFSRRTHISWSPSS